MQEFDARDEGAHLDSHLLFDLDQIYIILKSNKQICNKLLYVQATQLPGQVNKHDKWLKLSENVVFVLLCMWTLIRNVIVFSEKEKKVPSEIDSAVLLYGKQHF